MEKRKKLKLLRKKERNIMKGKGRIIAKESKIKTIKK